MDAKAAARDGGAKNRSALHACTNVYDLLQQAAERFGNDDAVLFLTGAEPGDEVIRHSHRDMFEQAVRTANLLSQLGIGGGEVVTLLMPNLPQTLWCMWGSQIAAVANPINHLLEPVQIVAIMREARARAVIVPDATAFPDIDRKLREIRKEIPGLIVIRLGGFAGADEIDYQTGVAQQTSTMLNSPRRIDPTALAALFHTGGTTGAPKLAKHHHGALAVVARTNIDVLSREREVALSPLPFFHVGGALLGALAAIANGWTIVIPTAAGARHPRVVANYWRIVADLHVTVAMGVPTTLAAALMAPREGCDLTRLKMLVTGGSAAPVALIVALQRALGVPVVEGFGMTEAHCIICATPQGTSIRPGSVGFGVEHMEIRIAQLDADAHIVRDCACNEIGLLLLRGPQIFQGYLNPAQNREVLLEDGWLNTGDLARRDADGYIWITGRAKDMIIRGGHNIDPLLIEDVLSRHADVTAVAAVGQPDAYAGELPIAFVQLRPGATASPEELLQFTRESISERAATPVEILLIEQMPLTAVGKILKPALRNRAAQLVFDRTLAPLRQQGLDAQALVVAHPAHGLIAQLAIGGATPERRQEIESWCAQAFGGFQLKHEILWRECK